MNTSSPSLPRGRNSTVRGSVTTQALLSIINIHTTIKKHKLIISECYYIRNKMYLQKKCCLPAMTTVAEEEDEARQTERSQWEGVEEMGEQEG